MEYHSQDLRTFIKYVNYVVNLDDIKTIFDVGSCHCLEAVEFSKLFKTLKYIVLKQILLQLKIA
jgi:hypothetical protein